MEIRSGSHASETDPDARSLEFLIERKLNAHENRGEGGV